MIDRQDDVPPLQICYLFFFFFSPSIPCSISFNFPFIFTKNYDQINYTDKKSLNTRTEVASWNDG